MNSIILFALGIIITAIISYFVSRNFMSEKINVVSAGAERNIDKTDSMPFDLCNNRILYNGRYIDLDKNHYMYLRVNGNSMEGVGIYPENFIIVDLDINKNRIEKGSSVVFKIDKRWMDNEHPRFKYKSSGLKEIKVNEDYNYYYMLRQLLGYVDIDIDNETICSTFSKIDSNLTTVKYKELLSESLNKARSNGIVNQTVTISIDKKKNGKNYYVNTIDEIYGCVKYVINRDEI